MAGVVVTEPTIRMWEREVPIEGERNSTITCQWLMDLGTKEWAPGRFRRRSYVWCKAFDDLGQWIYDFPLAKFDNTIVFGRMHSERMKGQRLFKTYVSVENIRILPQGNQGFIKGHAVVPVDEYNRLKLIATYVDEYDLPKHIIDELGLDGENASHGPDDAHDPEHWDADGHPGGDPSGAGFDLPD